ncbi:MAG: hypothetical protein WJ306_12675 [Ferrovum myxofaciens]|nr:hypothetical protein [Ferrovum myxofaciens]
MNKTGGFPGLACGASKDVKRRSRSRPLALKQEILKTDKDNIAI